MESNRLCAWCPNELPGDAEKLCRSCAEKEAMLKEGLTKAPEFLERPDMDRFFWKLAVYAIKSMEPKLPDEAKKLWTLEHVRASLALPVLEALPVKYVSVIKNDDEEEGVVEVRYTLKTPIPKMLLYQTVERLGIWNRVEKDSEPEVE